MFWFRYKQQISIAASVMLVMATAFTLRKVTLSSRMTNRAVLIGSSVVVFPVCETKTLSGVRDHFPHPDAVGGKLRC